MSSFNATTPNFHHLRVDTENEIVGNHMLTQGNKDNINMTNNTIIGYQTN